MSECTKRTRDDVGDDGCRVSLVSVTPMRIMVELLEGILANIEFKVDRDGSCIRVMSMDPAGICVVTAKLVCSIDADGDFPGSFTVSSSILKTCLKTLNSYHSLDIVLRNHAVASKLLLIAYEVSSSITTKFELPMLDICSKSIGSFDLSYDFTFEMELNTLRNITKNAILLKGDEIQFTVRANTFHVELAIVTDGGAKQEHIFVARKKGGSDPVRIDEGAELDENTLRGLSVRYMHRFSVSYVNKFLAADSQLISLRLSTNKPLILNYPLGVEDSYVSFVLSPRVTDSDL